MYPVMLDLQGRACLVVGGGGVALRKVEALSADGARIRVVARDPVEAFGPLAEQGTIELERRDYRSPEAAEGGYALVFAATDDRATNRRVFDDAQAAGIWVNVADDPELCSFHLPARIRRGGFQLAVASAGEAPFAVRRMRQLLERRFGLEWSEWADAAARFRRSVRAAELPREAQERCYDRFFQTTVDGERIRARVPTAGEEAALLEGIEPVCDPEQGPRREPDCAPPAGTGLGRVSLVGSGPGDPGLLSLRGRQRMLAADAVVYDRLALPALPADLPATVELHPVGKRASHHTMPQEEINSLLVRLARQGKRVVRFKGGDPFVFGRGGEEALALAEAGIAFEIVPAVTAGVAVPAYAGIPVTHRNQSVRLTLVTAHESEKSEGPQVRWDLLAQDPHVTLVGYMGVTSLPLVAARLIEAGMAPDTPAALIQRGTTPSQRSLVSTLAKLHADGQRAGIGPPAVFVIGPTVALAGQLDWWARQPLAGQRLALVAPGGALGEALEEAGAQLVEVPLPVAPAARAVLGALPLTACLLRGVDQVEALDEERDGAGWQSIRHTYCIGTETARRARAVGFAGVLELASSASPAQVVEALTRSISS